MNAIEQYFHVVVFISLLKVVLTFKFVDNIPVWHFVAPLIGMCCLLGNSKTISKFDFEIN